MSVFSKFRQHLETALYVSVFSKFRQHLETTLCISRL